VQTSSFPSTSKTHVASHWLGLLLLCMPAMSCVSTVNPAEQDILHGSIAWPFADETKPLGQDVRGDSLVIKSATSAAEYTIEIPGNADDWDITVPLAALEPGAQAKMERAAAGNPATTDRELISQMPKLEERHPGDTALLDAAYGVAEKGGPTQSPSYTMGIAKVNNFYRERKYEFALIELNNLIAFFPTAAQLHKMKGTVLMKMQNWQLAEKSWLRALDLAPGDASLRRGLERLQARMAQSPATPVKPVDEIEQAQRDTPAH
jgi:hypothetical protein